MASFKSARIMTSNGRIVFNTNNVITTETEPVSSADLTAQLNDYLPTTGGLLSGSLNLQNNSLVINNIPQTRAFSETINDKINTSETKLTNISLSNGQTNITGTTNISSLSIPDNNLTMSKINNLNSTITTINSNITTNTNNITTNSNNIATNSNDIETINATLLTKTDNSDFNTFKTNAENKINNISRNNTTTTISGDTNINNLIIPDANLSISKINNLQSSLDDIEASLTNHSSSISTINTALISKTDIEDFTDFQNEINNKLTDVSYSNSTTTINNELVCDELNTNTLIVNSSLEIDGTFIISNNNYTITDQQFSYLQDIDENIKTKITNIDSSITGIEVVISTMDGIITTHSTSLTILEGDNTTNKSNISALQSSNTTNENNINLLQTDNNTNKSDIVNLKSRMTTAESNIAVKQNILNNTNRLNTVFIADGSVSNSQFQTLNGINTNQTIQYQIDTINTSISTLTNIPAIQSEIEDLDSRLSGLNIRLIDVESQITTLDIEDIQATLATHTTDITTLNTFKTNQETYNDTNDSDIATLNTFKTNQETYNNTNDSDIATLNTFKTTQETYNNTNDSDIATLNTFKTTQETYNNTNDSDIATLNTFKTNQQTYNGTNNTNINTLNTFKINQESYNETNDTNIATLNTFKTNQEIYNNTNDTNITNLQDALDGKQPIITNDSLNIDHVLGLHDALTTPAYDSIAYDNVLFVTTITGTTIIDELQSTVIDTINTNLSGKWNTPSNGSNLSHVDISSSLNDLLDTKQNNINDSNKLASSSVSTYINTTNGVLSNVLQSITDINTTQSSSIATHTDDITNLNNGLISVNNSITTLNTNIGNLQSQDITHTNAIDDINEAIDTINDDIDLKQNIINVSNKVSSDYISTNLNEVSSNLSTVLSDFDEAITNLEDTKQDLLNSTTNKLPIANVNLGTSALSYVDISSSLTNLLTNITNDVSTLNGLQSGDITSFQNINSELTLINQDLSDLDIAIQTKHNTINASNRLNANLIGTGDVSNEKFNYLQNLTGDIQTQINNMSGGGSGIASISYNSGTTTTTISNTTLLNTLKFSSDNSIQETAFTSTKNTDLSDCKTKLTDISYSGAVTTIAGALDCDIITGDTIRNINTAISSKQDELNSTTNKLNPTYINGGDSLTSQKIGWLSSIAQDLQTKLDALQSSIDALSTADSSQTTLNTSLTNSINSLTTDKQDLLSESNKLNSAHLNAGTGEMSNLKMQYLSSIGGDINDALNSKQNNITDDSLTIARTLGLQTALDGKMNIFPIDIIAGTTGNITLTSANANSIIAVTLTAARNCTMPDPTTIADGTRIIFNVYSSGGFDLAVKNFGGSSLITLLSVNTTTGMGFNLIYSASASKWLRI